MTAIAPAGVYGLTQTMRYMLLVIQELTAPDGRAPSFDELRREMCLSSNGRVSTIIDALVDRGYVARLPGRARSLVVLRSIPMPEEPEIDGFFGDTAGEVRP